MRLKVGTDSTASRQRSGRRVAVGAQGQRGAGHVVADHAPDAGRPRRSSVHSWSGILSGGFKLFIEYWNSLPLPLQLRIVITLHCNVWDFQRATTVFRHRPRVADELEWSQRSLATLAPAADAEAKYERHNAFLILVWSQTRPTARSTLPILIWVIIRDRKNSFSTILN